MEYLGPGGRLLQELAPLAVLLRAAAIPAPARLGPGCSGARHPAMAKAVAALPEHPVLIACPGKPETRPEKEKVKE